jgi:hypothetical protein
MTAYLPDSAGDFLIDFLVLLRGRMGTVLLGLAIAMAYAGVTSVLAVLERRWTGRSETGNVPFFQNYSTLVDFAVLDPVLIVLAVGATEEMFRLPAAIEGSVAIPWDTAVTLKQRYLELLTSKLVAPVTASLGAAAWIIYALRLRPEYSMRERARAMTFVGCYIGIMTAVLIYIVASFTYRAFVTVWYVSVVTRNGFVGDKIEWGLGMEEIGGILSRVNSVYLVLTLILLMFAVHDLLIYKRRFPKRRLRVVGTMAFVVLVAVTALAVPVINVHEHVVATKRTQLDLLYAGRRLAPTNTREAIELKISEIKSLEEWPLKVSGGILPIAGYMFALLASELVRRSIDALERRRTIGRPTIVTET